MSFSASVDLGIECTNDKSLDLSTPTDALTHDVAIALAAGTGDDQADRIYHDTRTLAATTNDDLDLAGALVDGIGQSFVIARVKVLLIHNLSSQTLSLQSDQANPWVAWAKASGDGVNIAPNGVLLLAAPKQVAFPVTAGSADILRIRNNGASSADYNIVIIGATA